MNDGIYYIPAPAGNGSSVRFRSFATGQDREISSISQPTFQGTARTNYFFTVTIIFMRGWMEHRTSMTPSFGNMMVDFWPGA